MLVLSLVIGPPEEICFDLSLRVRSGLMAFQLWPSIRLKRIDAGRRKAVGIVRGEKQWEIPLEAVLQSVRPAHRDYRAKR